ncbi:MAG: helix-hairpin-helix domain-containing protein [Betaproteobacteria bacterium]
MRLQEVDGIGPKLPRASSLHGPIRRRSARSDLLARKRRRHVAGVRIFKSYGADAIRVCSENPYRLARDIRGIGFNSAELIASKLGIEKTAMIRARAGVADAVSRTEALDAPLARRARQVVHAGSTGPRR